MTEATSDIGGGSEQRRLVVTVHGIRTYGRWQEQFETLLKTYEPKITVRHFRYGYFSAIAFILPFTRWLMVRWFKAHLKSAAVSGDWDRIDIVAHSFGTHLAAWGLYRTPPAERPKVNTIIFASSVLKPGFPWRELMPPDPNSCIMRVINDCGVRDSVLLLNQVVVLGTGMAGRVGFSGFEGEMFVNRYFNHGHSGYFLGDFMEQHWLPLLLSSNDSVDRRDERPPLSVWRGILTFIVNNIEPIKLTAYILPLVGAILFVNGLRMDAIDQRNEARYQVAASTAYAYSLRDPTLAIQLAVDSYRNSDDPVTSSLAMLRAFNTGSWFYSERIDKTWSSDISPDGNQIAWIPEGGKHIHVKKLDKESIQIHAVRASWVRFCSNDRLLTWTGPSATAADNKPLVSLLDVDGKVIGQWEWHHLSVHLQDDGFAAVSSFSKNRQRVLHIINTKSGDVTTWPIETDSALGGGIDIKVIVFDNGKSFLVADSFPSKVSGLIKGEPIPSHDVPDGTSIVALTVDEVDRIAVMVLRANTRGASDAIAWTEISDSGLGALNSLPVPASRGESGAQVHVLDDHRVLATSTTGWTRIVDLKTQDMVAIDQDRGFDAISISQRYRQFAVARRSGDVSLYDYDGNKTGILLAETGSDGLNPQFEHIRFTDDGTKIITQSRRTTRVWLRPRFTLSKSHDESFRPFDDKIPNAMLDKVASECGTLGDFAIASDYQLSDTGMFSLSISLSGRPDYLPAYLSKNDLDLIGSSKWEKGNWIHYWTGNNLDRIFVLSPEIVAAVIEEEISADRLWRPNSDDLDKWVSSISGQ